MKTGTFYQDRLESSRFTVKKPGRAMDVKIQATTPLRPALAISVTSTEVPVGHHDRTLVPPDHLKTLILGDHYAKI